MVNIVTVYLKFNKIGMPNTRDVIIVEIMNFRNLVT